MQRNEKSSKAIAVLRYPESHPSQKRKLACNATDKHWSLLWCADWMIVVAVKTIYQMTEVLIGDGYSD